TCAGCRLETSLAQIECFVCDASQQNPIGTCEPASSAYCLKGPYESAYPDGGGAHCDCSDHNVQNCLSGQHVCLHKPGALDWCSTCGEADTGQQLCKGGGNCLESASPPSCQ